jgi:NADH-quinone oxidoreductase subunit F
LSELLLSRNFGVKDSHTLEVYKQSGGYKALDKALKQMTPAEIIEEVKTSNLRGRGGAGFPAGLKWSFMPKESKAEKSLVVNADEGEPGTFKDRAVMEKDPHMLLEGIAIAGYALGVKKAYVYVRGEFVFPAARLGGAIKEAYANGLLGKGILGTGFDLDVYIVRGAGAYICGEETALMESIEGKRGYPRLKPPFPTQVGVFGGPSVINNVETLACVPHIIERGGHWYASLGVERDGGTRFYAVSGHVVKPGIYELPTGTPLREIIYDHAGGIKDGRALKAVIPGGSSAPVLKADEIDVVMSFDSVAKAGSMLGSGGVMVMDERTCMVKAAYIVSRFYAHESCGQCTPCREGTAWMHNIIGDILNGQGHEGDVDLLGEITGNIMGRTICPLGDAAAMPIQGFLKKFRDEFVSHVKEKRCTLPSAGEGGGFAPCW